MFKKTVIYKNTAAKISALLCLISGVALFLLAGNGYVAIPALAQVLSIALIAASIYIATVFLLRVYTYSIEPNTHIVADDDLSAQYDFIITDEKGKRSIKVCHIEMTDVISLKVITPESRKQISEERKAMKRYTYDTRFAASKQLEVRARIDGEDYSVIITYDEEIIAAFKKFGK